MTRERQPGSNGEESSRAINIKESEFPKDPEARLEALLSSFNASPKSVTLLLLPRAGTYISHPDLWQRFIGIYQDTDFGQVHELTPRYYCVKTLCPIGLVARELTIDNFGSEKLIGFSLTDAGGIYGIDAACLALHFEYHRKVSLFSTLGSIHKHSTSEHRAPYTRAKILIYLSQKRHPVRAVDISGDLNTYESLVIPSLRALARAQLIDYEAISRTGKVQVSYTIGKLSASEIRPHSRPKPLREQIAKICIHLAEEALPITATEVLKRTPKKITKNWQQESLQDYITKTLALLANQGFLERGKFSRAILSTTSINDRGRLVVSEFLEPLLGLVHGDENVHHHIRSKIVPEVLGRLTQYARGTLPLYYEHSLSYKKRHSQENDISILNLISQFPQGSTARELGEKTNLSQQRIKRYLKPLVQDGEVIEEIRKFVSYFKPKPK